MDDGLAKDFFVVRLQIVNCVLPISSYYRKTWWITFKEKKKNWLLCLTGESSETSGCNEEACIKDKEWTEWEEWSSCSKSCGGGSTQRSRVCQVPERSGDDEDKPCPGPSTVMLFCNLQDCPVSQEWTPWNSWSECSRKCGGGTRSRNRICEKRNLIRDDEELQQSTCPGNKLQI